MKVLIIKTSSMGDVIHTLPALSDAASAIPGIEFDWVVEKSFQDIPHWHPAVKRVLPIEFRKWRKTPLRSLLSKPWQEFYSAIREQKYDLVIDAQGLTKSALLARLAHGQRHGLSSRSARDPIACIHYHKRHKVSWDQHAVSRLRHLFADAIGYDLPTTAPTYGIDPTQLQPCDFAAPYVVFLHGTTWVTKLWPESYWAELAARVIDAGFNLYLPSGNQEEYDRAKRIAGELKNVTVMPRKEITELASILYSAKGAVAVDTGLGHLAAALEVPNVSLYGATDAAMTGAFGKSQVHLQAKLSCAPCLQKQCTYKGAREVEPQCFASLRPE